MSEKISMTKFIPLIFIIVLLLIGSRFWVSVPAGHVAVATLFGEVQTVTYKEGLNIPVNPLLKFHLFDVREKTHKETAQVPSQDQLQTKIDVSVQYRLNGDMANNILKDTGNIDSMITVQLVPKLRSLLREQGKSIKRAEDFFLEETQEQLQTGLTVGLSEYLEPKGINVSAVLIRDISLPPFITRAIEAKKEREQEVEKQKAELERYKTEQQQLIAQAEAQKQAAAQQAEKRRLLADAQAYEIEKINEAIGSNPNYVKLQALEALKSISKDPASKIYFIDSDSPQPLPLMHMSEDK
ncbi:prohibitin family protein [Marinicella sp. S1101]|uniref:prohibitin family protein n=1 Tax=Marinicella marina TaxID=2996016 RepID=UPI002260CF84|nr:prohibitin family protein [Marinicella marina]MCX7553855.1 prohibitin family protein [Marinicella marina]MDJ1140347.1 prohibitin family protein [Marinicella marina]